MVVSGDTNSAALSISGQIYFSGYFSRIDFSVNNTSITARIRLGSFPIMKIATRLRHWLILTVSGQVYTWGDNRYGQLGLGNRNPCTLSEQINLPETFKMIAAGINHSLALTVSDQLYGWGNNEANQVPAILQIH
jgi:alpha-tubulin suppressor-like RCC1 family protein